MARETLKSLQAEVARLNETVSRLSTEKHEYRKERDEANESLKTARDNFGDLKRRLHEAETENARLRGYQDRVHEDDIVRDGFVEIEDEQGKRIVPKRPPPNRAGMTDFEALSPSYDQYGRQKKRTHWTSY